MIRVAAAAVAVMMMCGAVAAAESAAANGQTAQRAGGMLLRETVSRTLPGGGTRSLDVIVPWRVATRRPLVAVGHGFGRSPSQMVEVAEALARRGYPVVLLRGINGQRNAADLEPLLASPPKIIAQRARAREIVLVGHSAGGAAALAATAQLQSRGANVRAVVLLDAVPARPRDIVGLTTVSLRLISLRAEPNKCNAFNTVTPFLRNLAAPTLDVRIVGATHCDPEGPSDNLCAWSCGAATPAHQAMFRELTALVLEQTATSAPVNLRSTNISDRLRAEEKSGRVVYEFWNADTNAKPAPPRRD